MMNTVLHRLRAQLPMIGLIAVAGAAIWVLAHIPVTHAQTSNGGDKICRAAMIIDRSGSVDQQNPHPAVSPWSGRCF